MQQAAYDGLLPDPRAVEKLEGVPPFPALAGDLWAVYAELHSWRAWGELGPVRLSWRELEGYSRVSGYRFDPFSLGVIRQLEDTFFAVQAENKQ